MSSRYLAALEWGRATAARAWGGVAAASAAFEFGETRYYDESMGQNLRKQFLIFQPPYDPAETASRKLLANAWETEYAELGRHAEPRPLNLDSGYMTLAKLVLASTKDHAHRIYLHSGIYAEVTLYYKDKGWRDREWTFPDYRRADYQAFFSEARELLRQRGTRR